jgi:hypothetical protein
LSKIKLEQQKKLGITEKGLLYIKRLFSVRFTIASWC